MRFIEPVSCRTVVVSTIVLGLSISTWVFSAAGASAADKVETKVEKKDEKSLKQRTEKGEFAAFENGTLTLRIYSGDSRKSNVPELRKMSIPESAKTFLWNHDENRLQPFSTAEAMHQLTALVAPVGPSHVDTAETMRWRKAGTGLVVQFAGENVTIHIGQQKSPYVGTFGSFRDDFLLFHFKNPSLQFRKNYGDSVRFKMNESIPVYESIDGDEYRRAGTPREVLSKVKEGENIAVYHYYKTETDEFYLVLVGAKKK